MARSNSVGFGGELESKYDPASLKHAREAVFLEVAKTSPEAIETLRARVLPAYQNLAKTYALNANTHVDQEFAFETFDPSTLPEVMPSQWRALLRVARHASQSDPPHELALAMIAWGQEYRLIRPLEPDTMLVNLKWWQGTWDGWLLDRILLACSRWSLHPEEIDITNSAGYWAEVSDSIEFEPLAVPAWNPSLETAGDFKSRALEAVRTKLAEEVEMDINAQREHAYEKPPRRPALDDHVSWLVDFQVRALPYGEIARTRKLAEPSSSGRKRVESGVKSLAKFVGIRLRDAKSGRPSTHYSVDE